MKMISYKNLKGLKKIKRVLVFFTAFIVTYSILVTSLIPQKYDLKEGDIAKNDIKAPRTMIDEKATTERINQVKESITPPAITKAEVGNTAIENIKSYFGRVQTIKESAAEEKDKLSRLKAESGIEFKDEEASLLMNMSKEDLTKTQEFIIKVLKQLYSGRIEDNKSEAIKAANESLIGEVNKSDLPEKAKPVVTQIAQMQIKPNYFIDKQQYEEMIKERTKGIQVEIQKGQIIVEEGKPVTDLQMEILKGFGLVRDDKFFEWYIYLSLGVLVFMALLLQWIYLFRYNREIFNDNSKLVLISIVDIISLLLARSLSLISPFLIPMACAPMLLTLLIDYNISVVLSMINTILLSGVVGFNIEITLIAVLNAVLGAVLLKKMQARNDILYSAIFIALINIVMTFCVGVLLNDFTTELLKKSGLTGLGSLISAVLAVGFLPFLESTFDIVTTIKLLELSNPNQKLLKRLLIEAPGTYHHSILVANLAEVAAEEVGGNPVLARVGAYYHDVGKIKRPYFFKENQMGNDNPHAKITPNLSSLVITSHVKDGIELARQEKLPKTVQDIIEQHHGTALVKYFYITMKNLSEKPEEVNEEDFRYPGPIPSSKEAGVIMLADSVEAAVRSISEPTSEKIAQMVDSIIKDRLDDGQLHDCDLTLRDLDKIKRAFLKSLTGIYHQRIEYPKDKWENKKE